MHDENGEATQPAQKAQTKRGRLVMFLKIAVTVGGLLLVVSRFDPGLIARTLATADLRWVLVGVALLFLGLVVRAWRWQVILKGSGAWIPFPRLVELYLVGSFFNAFLPSGLGGDVVRATEAAHNVPVSVAVSSVVIDRLTGLMALFIMALGVLPFRPPDFPLALLWVIVTLSCSGLLAGLVLVDGRLATWILAKLPAAVRNVGGGIILRTIEAVDRCEWRALGLALLISILFNLIQVAWWYASGRALSLLVPLSYYVLVVPIFSLALLLPSIGGLGVRETLAPTLFGSIMLPEQAVALTLLVFGLERAASLLGAPVYIYSTLRESRAAHDGQTPTPDSGAK